MTRVVRAQFTAKGRMGVLVGPQTEIQFAKQDGSQLRLKASAKK